MSHPSVPPADEAPSPDGQASRAADVLAASAEAGSDHRLSVRDGYRQRLQALQDQLELLRGEPPEQALAVAEQLTMLERQFLELTAEIDHKLPESRAIQGNPVLDDLAEWSELAHALGLNGATEEADAATREVFEANLREWNEDLEQRQRQEPQRAAFAGLIEATTHQLEAIARCPRQPPGVAYLTEQRGRLREQLLAEIKERPPSDDLRTDWTTQLVDRADVVLTAIDDMPPAQASAYLSVVIDDLDWYARQVENRWGWRRRRLQRKLNRLRAERQERQLQDRLERRFGTRWVARWERLILGLIILVLGILTVQLSVSNWLSPWQMVWLEIADGVICAFFLIDFFTKFSLVPDRWAWFRRHWLFGLLPSIPFGLILLISPLAVEPGADATRFGRIVRFFRLPRLARYVIILRPFIRLLRAFGFMMRGLDRIARKLGPVLNRNIILYPNREERRAARLARQAVATHIRRVHAELVHRWKHLVVAAAETERPQVVLGRVGGLRQAYHDGLVHRSAGVQLRTRGTREISAEEMLRWLATLTPQDVEAELRDDLLPRAARIVKLFSRPPVSWLPLINACMPRVKQTMSDAEVVAAATRRTASLLKKYHDRWFWVADLYGTVTPSQFVDRLGTMLIKSATRPVYRLLMFGGAFLLFNGLFMVLPFSPPDLLRGLLRTVEGAVGTTLAVLGGICLVIMGLGFWLKRLAQEATEFYERSAQAQFLSLTETIRSRSLLRDAGILYDRVLGPEAAIGGCAALQEQRAEQRRDFVTRVKRALIGVHVRGENAHKFDAMERVVLLYRDGLDGALLADSDTRTTSQLLGNPALQQMQAWSYRIDKGAVKALQALDLERQKSLLPGPYLWFNFISRAIAHSVARLIIEYNHHAVPLLEQPRMTPNGRQRFRGWLQQPSDAEHHQPPEDDGVAEAATYVTTAFTALHFLDVDSQRDQEVAERFGPEVLQRLQRDRSLLIRRVFGTFPLHNQPKEKRVINLYVFYENWLAGGRAVLLPVFLLGRFIHNLISLAAWLWQSLREIHNPRLRVDPMDAAQADFGTAARKIDRMRAPITHASIRLRAMLDPEYLGLHIPGLPSNTLGQSDVDADLAFLDADPWLLEAIGEERRRAEADMERLGSLLTDGLLVKVASELGLSEADLNQPDVLRATACAYLGDLKGVRRCLSARAILSEVFHYAAHDEPLPPRPWLFWSLRRKFNRYGRSHGFGDAHSRRAAWRAVEHNVWGVADALDAWAEYGDGAEQEGLDRLAELLRFPARITEQLVTLRTVQTLALLDILNYRQHIFQLGNYAAQGDDPGDMLVWGAAHAQAHQPEQAPLDSSLSLRLALSED